MVLFGESDVPWWVAAVLIPVLTAAGYAAKWLYDRWADGRDKARKEEVEDDARQEGKVNARVDALIARADKAVADREREFAAYREEWRKVEYQQSKQLEEVHEELVEIKLERERLRVWVRYLEDLLTSKGIPHLKFDDPSAGSSPHIALPPRT